MVWCQTSSHWAEQQPLSGKVLPTWYTAYRPHTAAKLYLQAILTEIPSTAGRAASTATYTPVCVAGDTNVTIVPRLSGAVAQLLSVPTLTSSVTQRLSNLMMQSLWGDILKQHVRLITLSP